MSNHVSLCKSYGFFIGFPIVISKSYITRLILDWGSLNDEQTVYTYIFHSSHSLKFISCDSGKMFCWSSTFNRFILNILFKNLLFPFLFIFTENVTLPQVFFERFAKKNKLTGFYISETLVISGIRKANSDPVNIWILMKNQQFNRRSRI